MIDKLIAILNELHPDIPIYSDDITEEERLEHQSFFIYRNSNRYRRGNTGRGLYRELDLFYVTVEQKEINIGALVETISDKTPLFFSTSEEDFGKLVDLDKTAFMVTMTFSYPVKACFS